MKMLKSEGWAEAGEDGIMGEVTAGLSVVASSGEELLCDSQHKEQGSQEMHRDKLFCCYCSFPILF